MYAWGEHQTGHQSKWEKIWNDIQKKEGKYFYFYGYDKSEDGTEKPLYSKSYVEGMDAEVGNIVSNIKKIGEQDGVSVLIKDFEEKRDRVMRIEKSLLEQIDDIESARYVSTSNIENDNRIRIWTNVFAIRNAMTGNVINLNPQDCFRTLITSNEFILSYRDKSSRYSTLSMTKFYQGFVSDKKGKFTKTKREEAIRNFYKQLKNPNSELTKIIKNTIIESLNKDMKNINKEIVSDDLQGIFDDLMEQLKTLKDYTYLGKYEKIKGLLKDNLEDYLSKYYIDGMETPINFRAGGDGVIFLTISLVPPEAGIYTKTAKNFLKDKDEDYKLSIQDKIRIFKEAVRDTSESIFQQNPLTLSLDYAGKTVMSDDLLDDFKNKVKEYLNNFLDIDVENVADKNPEFFAQDWNSSVMTGMLGELATYLIHFPQTIKELTIVGNKADSITIGGKKLGLGEGFRDLTFEYNSIKYGINVKRYVNSGNNFNLYKDEQAAGKRGVGIGSQYMYRYFSQEEVNLMRFIEGNYLFIQQKLQTYPDFNQQLKTSDVNNLYIDMATAHIDHFVRLSSPIEEDSVNLFYMINNLAIPASTIYDQIIAVLKEYKAKDMFSITRSKPPKYQSLISTKVYSENSNVPISVDNPGNLLNNAAKIVFNGLTLNNLKTFYNL